MASPSFLPTDESVVNSSASAAAPAANTVLASFTPPAGMYRVLCRAYQAGTPDANVLNAVLKRAGSAIHNLPTPGTPSPFSEVYLKFDGTQTIQVTVGGTAGGAGAIYIGELIVSRMT